MNIKKTIGNKILDTRSTIWASSLRIGGDAIGGPNAADVAANEVLAATPTFFASVTVEVIVSFFLFAFSIF